MLDPVTFNNLRRFRAGVYDALGPGAMRSSSCWTPRRSPGWCTHQAAHVRG